MANRRPDSHVNLVTEPVSIESELHDNDILSIDSIYYPGVFDYIKKQLSHNNTRKVLVIMNAYTNIPGTYYLYFKEGHFNITQRGEKTYVTMCPNDNSANYEHELFRADPYRIRSFSRNGVYFD